MGNYIQRCPEPVDGVILSFCHRCLIQEYWPTVFVNMFCARNQTKMAAVQNLPRPPRLDSFDRTLLPIRTAGVQAALNILCALLVAAAPLSSNVQVQMHAPATQLASIKLHTIPIIMRMFSMVMVMLMMLTLLIKMMRISFVYSF
jgi:hypothetical protein